MGRLIDADKLKRHYSWWSNADKMKQTFDDVIDRQPTVASEGLCAKCGMTFYTVKPPTYCPHCGTSWGE